MNKYNETTIIKALRLMSTKSKSSGNFKAGLLQELEEKLAGESKSNFILSFITMKNYILPVAIAALVLVVGGSAVYLYTNKDGDDENVANNYDYNTVVEGSYDEPAGGLSGISLATDTHTSISAAQGTTSFTVKRATVRLGEEVLAKIETSQDVPGSENNQDSYFLTYAEDGKKVYQVNGLAMPREVIEGDAVTVNGMTAYYYKVPADQISDGNNIAAGETGPSARSFVYWNDNGKSYEVTEFTGLAKDELLKLAASVK